jgi:hypothetical protein
VTPDRHQEERRDGDEDFEDGKENTQVKFSKGQPKLSREI